MIPYSHKYDVVIVGGGPAGMSSALWCAELGLSSILIERESHLGGQLALIHNPISNYLGLKAKNGLELQKVFKESLANVDFERSLGVVVEKLDLGSKTSFMADGRSFEGNFLVIATGVRRRKLEIPGEKEFQGRGILSSGAGQKLDAKSKTVVIVGGGDAAIENALILSEFASRVIVVHRGSEFSARCKFIDAARQRPNIEFLMDTVLISIGGDKTVENVRVRAATTDTAIPTDLVLIRIGVTPNSQLVDGMVSMDDRGYINVDAKFATSISGVFAVGDVANPTASTISSATGSAATGIKSIASYPIK